MKSHWDTLYACDFLGGKVACRSRLGGMLNYYYREAA
jgi:hypothetical protein